MRSSRERAINEYRELIQFAGGPRQAIRVMRGLALRDLFFLVYWICGRRVDIDKLPEYGQDWIFDRCREYQAAPDDHLDLWSREHYKSTLITFGGTIQDVLNNPEITAGIFSFNRPTAKGFLRQIKREFESNILLKELFPDILWADPRKEAPKWSEDDGIIVQRTGNPKESTIEAWGLVDGQPTSRHFTLMIYDDVITRESVTNPEMILKVTEAWELSRNLTTEGGRTRYIGTRYHKMDTYRTMIERQAAIPRIYPGTDTGHADGKPVMWTEETLAKKRRDMGPYIFSCQILQDPMAEETQGFNEEWLRFWPAEHYDGMNIYILGDPASKKKKSSDYTVFLVIGLGMDQNYKIIDMVRDRINLKQRGDILFQLHRTYRPLKVGYEEYGLQADIEYFEERMERDNYYFDIVALKGSVAKEDRIKGLVPDFEQGRIYLPQRCLRMNWERQLEDLTRVFINEEYNVFPYISHDDMLDALARIKDPDLGVVWPMYLEEPDISYLQAQDEEANVLDPFA